MLEDDPRDAKTPKALNVQLYEASIGELRERIESLKAEIVLCEEAIAKKEAQRGAADSVFGKRSS
jgi:uncharacterized small protein (DUF1192 family)